MGAIGLFFVGAVLFVNGLLFLNKADAKGAAILNLIVGLLVGFVTVYMAFVTFINPHTALIPNDKFQFFTTAGTLLFSVTYLMVAGNIFYGGDGRAVGWYSLWVALVAVPTGLINWLWFGDWRFGIIWLSWAALWFCYFLLLGLQRTIITRFTAWFTMFEAFASCTVPAYLILLNVWK